MSADFPELACPCCGEPMANRPTHAGKPHYVCEQGCGAQLFIRTALGIERLTERHGGRRKEEWKWA